MRLEENSVYEADVRMIAQQSYPWEKLENKSFLISGATYDRKFSDRWDSVS